MGRSPGWVDQAPFAEAWRILLPDHLEMSSIQADIITRGSFLIRRLLNRGRAVGNCRDFVARAVKRANLGFPRRDPFVANVPSMTLSGYIKLGKSLSTGSRCDWQHTGNKLRTLLASLRPVMCFMLRLQVVEGSPTHMQRYFPIREPFLLLWAHRLLIGFEFGLHTQFCHASCCPMCLLVLAMSPNHTASTVVECVVALAPLLQLPICLPYQS